MEMVAFENLRIDPAEPVVNFTKHFACQNCGSERSVTISNLNTSLPFSEDWRGPHACGECGAEIRYRIVSLGRRLHIEVVSGIEIVDGE